MNTFTPGFWIAAGAAALAAYLIGSVSFAVIVSRIARRTTCAITAAATRA